MTLHPIILKNSRTWSLGTTQMEVEVIAASVGPDSPPIFTLRMRYPRIIHSEIMTHRVFSRNARSSRAVPVAKMIDEIRKDPFVPWHWGKNQKGMQADEECNNIVVPTHWFGEGGLTREEAWLHACEETADIAEAFMNAGYHKQICNRLLEPFMWIDTLITSTDWKNFLWLRDHKDAEPHLQDLARLVTFALMGTKPKRISYDDWHLPYVAASEYNDILIGCGESVEETLQKWNLHPLELMKRLSAARCARISYAPFDGNADYDAEIMRYNSLVSSDRVHASPVEHQATPDTFTKGTDGHWRHPQLHGNLEGYIQFRKQIHNERKL